MQKLLTLALAASTLAATAQKTAKPDAFAKTIAAADMKKHLYILAAPDMEGRETGTEGQRKAAAYIEAYFKELGLQPGNGSGYQQFYSIYQDSLSSATLEVNGQAFAFDKDFVVGGSTPTTTVRIGEVVVLGGNATDSLRNADLTGRVVMVVGNANPAFFQQLMKKGPAGYFAVASNFPRNTPPSRRRSQTPQGFRRTLAPMQFVVSEAVAQAIGGAAYQQVKSNPTGMQPARTELLVDVKRTSTRLQASNVVGLLPGTDLKDEYVVISAHYDHVGVQNGKVYPGADDDGSGTVGIMEIAEAFVQAKKAGKGPRRSIVFLANSGEEKGLWGSAYYTEHPLFPLEKTTVNLNIDMIGRSDPDRKPDTLNYVYVVGDDKISSELKPISEAQNNKYTKLQLDYKYNDPNDKERIYYRSDHYNFARNGVPIIFYYDGMLRPDYHQPTDTPDKINYALMEARTRLVFYTGWEMANRNAMLKRDIPLPTGPGA